MTKLLQVLLREFVRRLRAWRVSTDAMWIKTERAHSVIQLMKNLSLMNSRGVSRGNIFLNFLQKSLSRQNGHLSSSHRRNMRRRSANAKRMSPTQATNHGQARSGSSCLRYIQASDVSTERRRSLACSGLCWMNSLTEEHPDRRINT